MQQTKREANNPKSTQDEGRSQNPKLQRSAIAWVLSLAILAIMGVGEAQTVADNWQTPGLYAKELPDILDLRARIPAGSSVTLTSDPRINGVTTALVAYMLDQATVLGDASTGYVPSWSNGAPGEIGDYALLLAGEDPAAQGFGGETVWQGAGFALYKRDSSTIAHLSLDRTLNPGETLQLPVSATQLGDEAPQTGSSDRRSLSLVVAALEPGELTLEGVMLNIPGGTIQDISGGLSIHIGDIYTPLTMTLRNSGTSPIVIRSATLMTPSSLGSPSGRVLVEPDSRVVLAQASAQNKGETVATTITTLVPDIGPVTLALDIWDHKRSAHYGWYGVEQPRTEATRTFTFTLALASGAMIGTDSAGKPLAIGGGLDSLQPGDYTASLNVQAGTQLLTAPAEVFDFSVGPDGNISNIRTVPSPIVAVRADTPPMPVSVSGPANDVQLTGYALSDEMAHPGGQISITLWWHSVGSNLDERSILLHLRDLKGDKRAQADGSPANGGRPTTTWQSGETIIDEHTIKIPSDLPPGRYNLAVGMYHYPSLEPVPLTQVEQHDNIVQPAKPLDGNVFLIPIEIKP